MFRLRKTARVCPTSLLNAVTFASLGSPQRKIYAPGRVWRNEAPNPAQWIPEGGGMSDELLNLSSDLLGDKELLDVEAHSLRAANTEPTEGEPDGDDEVEGHLLLPE